MPYYGGLNEGNACIHQLGRPCKKCGYVAIPVRFYEAPVGGVVLRDGIPYEKALANYKEWMRGNKPEWFAQHLEDMAPVTVTDSVTDEGMSQVVSQKVCGVCGEGFEGYGKNCSKCRKAKSRAK